MKVEVYGWREKDMNLIGEARACTKRVEIASQLSVTEKKKIAFRISRVDAELFSPLLHVCHFLFLMLCCRMHCILLMGMFQWEKMILFTIMVILYLNVKTGFVLMLNLDYKNEY